MTECSTPKDRAGPKSKVNVMRSSSVYDPGKRRASSILPRFTTNFSQKIVRGGEVGGGYGWKKRESGR